MMLQSIVDHEPKACNTGKGEFVKAIRCYGGLRSFAFIDPAKPFKMTPQATTDERSYFAYVFPFFSDRILY